MGLLNKSQIVAADDLKHEDVPVPQWGGSVRVRVMTGSERDTFRTFVAGFEGGAPVSVVSAALLVETCVDETGARMFSSDEIDVLREKSAEAVDTVAAVAMRLNGLGMTAVADAAKNSASGQSDDSGSDSQPTSAKA